MPTRLRRFACWTATGRGYMFAGVEPAEADQAFRARFDRASLEIVDCGPSPASVSGWEPLVLTRETGPARRWTARRGLDVASVPYAGEPGQLDLLVPSTRRALTWESGAEFRARHYRGD